ncbi:hypothetical protein LU290_03390 [Moraxella nasibovis]|uniref:antiterminator Q family protein n=1 Tax=Moraxella nasibovis TaxID=2904120 RepID=UPI00240F323D|nr:antiterminator Q family protein [Moraxella nasibovis]WFF39279.1 hypothetical protein LU290_03390 [Moraxella nasibovis]
MNWHKYTLNEWLEQFGAWCYKQGRVMPSRLETNQIYHLMQSVRPTPKTVRYCCITDDEALAVNRVLCETAVFMPDGVELLVLNKCDGMTVRAIEQVKGQKFNHILKMIDNTRHYLAGYLGLPP